MLHRRPNLFPVFLRKYAEPEPLFWHAILRQRGPSQEVSLDAAPSIAPLLPINLRCQEELLRHSNPLITPDAAYTRSTTPAQIEAQGWVMQQLLTDDSKVALAAAKPAARG
jgi:hypothetical protein